MANDIGLLKLTEEVQLGPNVQLACLPKKSQINFPFPNSVAYFAGWGRDEHDSYIAREKELKNIKVEVFDGTNSIAVTNRWKCHDIY